jgi:D-amino-acid dehydrogenase
MHHRPLVIKPSIDLALWRWCIQMLANCNERAYALNKGRMVRLAEYSRDCLRQLRADTGISYDERTQGTLQLFRTQQQLDGVAKDIEVLRQSGVPFEVLDRAGFVKVEPGLAETQKKFVGALRLPGDETGDCFKFTQQLAAMAQQQGAQSRFGVAIKGLQRSGDRISGVQTESGLLTADHYVLALGSYSTRMLAPLGIDVPVYPVKGFSITVPIVDAAHAPESTIMDETHKVAVTRLGDRIRVGGTAQLSGFNLDLADARRRTLEHVVTDLFPRGGDVARAEFWAGLRPMTPDGTPIVGGTRYANLSLSTGHGTLGWTMAAGTGRVMADLLSGREPEISLDGLTVARYGAAVHRQVPRHAATRAARA